MLNIASRTRCLAAVTIWCLLSVASVALAESPITTPHEIDEHYEVASKDFGDGTVQLHSKKVSAGATTHSIHSFDCTNKTYAPVYAGDASPDEFPVNSLGFNLSPIDVTTDVAPLAQHACKKHGYPLLEW
ncbi:hypothetical protein [Sedimentitalea todarodis]|uniref:Uncharacterized protein n=1 Tax=Sedimentitalea todarodis TaxID=1631240 RepID=A0ABU3V998_9RHOB|nr:hypothetical protein [Sedimentitalea todarodis]MDU9002668.1 hypothetical protein [Sedimentitalea todarodis]